MGIGFRGGDQLADGAALPGLTGEMAPRRTGPRANWTAGRNGPWAKQYAGETVRAKRTLGEANWFSRHVCCVTQQIWQLCDTTDLSAVGQGRHVS